MILQIVVTKGEHGDPVEGATETYPVTHHDDAARKLEEILIAQASDEYRLNVMIQWLEKGSASICDVTRNPTGESEWSHYSTAG